MGLRLAIAAAAAAAAFVVASPAAANGRFPAANQLVFSSADSKLVVLRTTFGILISRDYGSSWVWLCEEALGFSSSSQQDPPVALTADSMVVGTSSALETSLDVGCTWSVQGGALAHQSIVDVAVRPDSPDTVVALQSSYDAEAGAGNLGYQSQVFQSTDDGQTWMPLGVPIDAGVITTTIDVAAADPQRLYVSAYRPATEAGPPGASLFVSTNRGASWTERPLPALEPASESAAFIGAVDPADANVVYLRTGEASGIAKPSRLFVTRDAGQSFQAALQLKGPMLGFALSADGSRAFAGGPADGLLVAPSGSVGTSGAFALVTSSLHVQCLATHGTDLWACSDTQSGFIAGVSPTQNATFVPKLQLVDIQTPIACGADAAGAQCGGYPFVTLCRMLSNCPVQEGGPTGEPDSGGEGGRPDAATGTGGSSSGAGAGSSGAASSGSDGGSGSGGTWSAAGGCSVTGGGAAAGFAIAVLGAAAVARRRKR